MSMVKTRGVPTAKNKVAFYPHGALSIFGLPLLVGLKGRIGGQVALPTSSDPGKVSQKKWCPA